MPASARYRLALFLAVVSSALGLSRNARADFAGDARWFSAGVNLGAANHTAGTGFLFGAEASVGSMSDGTWFGGYVDALGDTVEDRLRLSLGPEVGFWILGLDVGYLADIGDGRLRSGAVVRPLLSFAFAVPYARFGFRSDADGGHFQEYGVLLKWPILLDEGASLNPWR